MFNVIKKAGLSVDEFASIVGISRVAVFNWKAGRSRPHPQVAERVKRAVSFIDKQTKSGHLPLDEELSREERRREVKKLKEQLAKAD